MRGVPLVAGFMFTNTFILSVLPLLHIDLWLSSARLPITGFLRSFVTSARASSSFPAVMSAAKTKAQGIIDDNVVAVFSKSYCPYCKATKSLLSEMGAKPYIIELDQVDDGAAIQDALEEITHQRSVPNVFIDHKHIGGNSDLQSKKAQLPELLKKAGAL
nr:glutaredoxin [Quercus suber]